MELMSYGFTLISLKMIVDLFKIQTMYEQEMLFRSIPAPSTNFSRYSYLLIIFNMSSLPRHLGHVKSRTVSNHEMLIRCQR